METDTRVITTRCIFCGEPIPVPFEWDVANNGDRKVMRQDMADLAAHLWTHTVRT